MAVHCQALLYNRSQCGIPDTDVCCCQAFRQCLSRIYLSVYEDHCCLAEWQTLAVAVIKSKNTAPTELCLSLDDIHKKGDIYIYNIHYQSSDDVTNDQKKYTVCCVWSSLSF